MIIEHFISGKQKELYLCFEEKGRMLPEGLSYIDSWVDEELKVCFQLMESETEELIHQWISNWKDFTEFEIFPVISSANAKKKILGF